MNGGWSSRVLTALSVGWNMVSIELKFVLTLSTGLLTCLATC